MGKQRLLILISTIIIVGIFGTIIGLYARGYRLDQENLEISPNGILVIKSAPDGAQVYINGELETATNATLPLAPGIYDVSVRKEGYRQWNKRLTIEKEIVTEATAHLFRNSPSLSAITFSGIVNPVPSKDYTKISYVIPPSLNGDALEEGEGLWVMENINLPLGFSREPRRITNGDLKEANWQWSPDGRQILLTLDSSVYLLDASAFTPQTQRVNVASQKEEILVEWEEEETLRKAAQIESLPDELEDFLERKAGEFIFSPDEDMVMYTASGSAALTPELIKQLPGSSTQKESRDIKPGNTYIYDIKEDRNFLIDEDGDSLIVEGGAPSGVTQRRLTWYATSRHVILAEPNQITIMDYDGTNHQTVYSGFYTAPHAYPTLSLDRLIILTNLGALEKTPDLYSLSIK